MTRPSSARAGVLFVSDEILTRADYTVAMPWGLKRFQQAGDLHFITFSCYHRKVKLGTGARREVVERALEHARGQSVSPEQ